MKIYYLVPNGGYSSELRSDTLWGMLCWGIRHLWGAADLDKFLEQAAAGKPEFVVSSTFPFKQHGKERIPFFPNPCMLAPDRAIDSATALEDYRLRKKFKAIEWLSQEDFSEVLHGKLTSADLLDRLRNEYQLKNRAEEEGNEYFPSGQVIRRTPPVLEVNAQTHNTIDRLRGGTLGIVDPEDPENHEKKAGQLFQAEELYWVDLHDESVDRTPNVGLFFLADGDTDKVDAVLRLFRHWGFGADRSTGKGFFEVKSDNFTFNEPAQDQSNALLNLSLFQPTRIELQNLERHGACWQYLLERREGYVGGYPELRRKEPRLYFREGSVFERPHGYTGRFMGCIRKQSFDNALKPPHEVWDNGFGFMVNLNWVK